ncbi:MAG: hypothetical protein LBQ61_05355 [Spirochaetales bacterium]|jgi:hypothetical protein|nr:hypothetical protein [Spirochaetales bacterium]
MKKLLLRAVLTGTVLTAAALEIYRSNSLGMSLESLDGVLTREGEYSLTLETNPRDEVIKTLYNGRRVEKTWTQVYLDGALAEEREESQGLVSRSFYQEGLLVRESREEEGLEGESREYEYQNRRLRQVTFLRGGEVLYRDRYRLDPAGRLLRIQREFPSGESQGVAYLFGDRGLIRESYREGDREEIFLSGAGGPGRYDRQERRGTEVLGEDRWENRDGRPVRIETRPSQGLQILWEYDGEDRLLRETRTRLSPEDPSPLEVREYRWEEDRLVELTVRTPGRRETYGYEYSEEGRREVMKKYVNRLLVLAVYYEDETVRWEEIYRDGRLLARVRYENDIPVETELPSASDFSGSPEL